MIKRLIEWFRSSKEYNVCMKSFSYGFWTGLAIACLILSFTVSNYYISLVGIFCCWRGQKNLTSLPEKSTDE